MVHRTVLQYQFTEKLGAGGMGEVYKARDTRLNRFVAIKVLPAGMSADPDRRRRFVQEAQAVSALNHPNIITIYDIVEDGEAQYMVVEYIAGKTLVEIIPGSGLPAQQAVGYAAAMADALAAAHSAGIVHRDLKPANVMVAENGMVKLLDFGLAKTMDWTIAENAGTTVTMHAPLTAEGAILGTVNYMSPEQAEGKRLDARSDIFSFGAVLYEMLTGRKAFRKGSTVATLSAILRDEVQPIRELAPGVPTELEGLVARCLKKDPDQRFQSMEEIHSALGAMKRKADSGVLDGAAVRQTRSSKAAVFGNSIVLVMALGAGCAWWWLAQHKSAPPRARVQPPAALVENPPVASPMTNETVVQMAEANVTPSVIINRIRSSKTNFDVSPAAVIGLTKSGVPDEVIEVMGDPLGAGTAPVSPATAKPPATVTLEDGLPIHLALAEDIPNNAMQGDAVRFTVAEAVRVDGAVVIPRGALAVGSIVDGAKKKVFGIGGKMTLRLDKVTAVGGQSVPIRATPERNRDGSSKRPVDTGSRKPKDVAAAAGARYAGYVEGPKTVPVKK